ncbi:MAG: hypothetical protein SF028_00530 [Candidatus Sumerlaeia bacterium]|nr:hypothetical protein [Candidatus Sumerlaeia bacterium]
MRDKRIIFGAAGLVAAVLLAVAAPRAQEGDAPAEPIDAPAPPSELQLALQRFEADSDPERALYLSAVQALEIGRQSGDMEFAEQLLLRIAAEAKRQSVRTSVRRLLVDLYMERGDWASARTNLETIVQESLIQF